MTHMKYEVIQIDYNNSYAVRFASLFVVEHNGNSISFRLFEHHNCLYKIYIYIYIEIKSERTHCAILSQGDSRINKLTIVEHCTFKPIGCSRFMYAYICDILAPMKIQRTQTVHVKGFVTIVCGSKTWV